MISPPSPTFLLPPSLSFSLLPNPNRYTNTKAGGRLLDFQYVYSVTTLFLSLLGGYLWTRFWLLVNTDEERLIILLKWYIIASVCTWVLSVSRKRREEEGGGGGRVGWCWVYGDYW